MTDETDKNCARHQRAERERSQMGGGKDKEEWEADRVVHVRTNQDRYCQQ